ncbi:MAG: 50S ribosomal protein L3 [Thermodesulfobacteriota bacterium]
MSRGLLGKKLGMMSLFSSDGILQPVTVIQAGPCVVTQIKTIATDGYNALQLGFGEKKASRLTKPIAGHLKKSGEGRYAVLQEFPVEKPEEFQLGQAVTLEVFKVGERVDVVGKTKGRGFTGVVKRHGFSGGKDTHGSMSHAVPGSIGSSAWPSRVVKGKKLPGQYGNERVTIRNLEIVEIRPDQHLILVKGAIPGSRSGIVSINKIK